MKVYATTAKPNIVQSISLLLLLLLLLWIILETYSLQ